MYIENTQQVVVGLFMMGFATGCLTTGLWVLFCRSLVNEMFSRTKPETKED